MKTKRVHDNLRMPKLKETFTTVALVYEAGICIRFFFWSLYKTNKFHVEVACSVIDHRRQHEIY